MDSGFVPIWSCPRGLRFQLAPSIAYRQAGSETEAEQWLARVIRTLEKGNMEWVQAATLLKGGRAPSSDEIKEIGALTGLTPAILADLSLRYPQSRTEYCRLARRLNVLRQFPFHLVQRVIEGEAVADGLKGNTLSTIELHTDHDGAVRNFDGKQSQAIDAGRYSRATLSTMPLGKDVPLFDLSRFPEDVRVLSRL